VYSFLASFPGRVGSLKDLLGFLSVSLGHLLNLQAGSLLKKGYIVLEERHV
jgi:hypothetical protein